jgi:uncharacterized RDD family membrane protein YckC
MDNEPIQPEKPAIPPPDLPPPPPPVPESAPRPVVNVKIREAGASLESEPESGGVAPLNGRIVAAVIDVLVAMGLQIAAAMLLPSFVHRITWLVGIAYLVTRDSLPFLGGQSGGKKAMKLRAVTLEGKPLTGNWEPALIRNAVLLIPFFGLIELFVLLTREGKPGHGIRLGDEWAKTKVIVAEETPATPGESP